MSIVLVQSSPDCLNIDVGLQVETNVQNFASQVTRLCDLSQDNDTVTSVSWSERVSVSHST